MTFYNYMIKHYLHEDSPKGDLAGDMKRDKQSFPIHVAKPFNEGHQKIQDYLLLNGACDACMDVFKTCWLEYEASELDRLKSGRL